MKCPKCGYENPADLSYCGKCGTQLGANEDVPAPATKTIETPKEELTTGSTFAGRYQIIEELGRGGMGRVYKAVDTEVNEKIALKLIKHEIAADKKTIERFRNELKFARKIRHRNVCQMYDLSREQGSYYITMEYVAGEDLKGLIKKMGQLSAGQATSIAKQVCEGLSEAHKLGVVHRDLKPQNIMIDKEGNARIMDFGIARSIEGKSITGAGVMIGTPDYMSPEQVDGKETDQRSDIYSLGIILYEMVTGRTPFEGETAFTIGVKHKSETPKPPKEWNAQIPDDLNKVILRCLEKEKERRYRSAGELRSDLSAIEQGMPTTEKVVPKKKSLTSREITVQLSPKKLLIPALIVAAVVIAAILIWQLIPQKEKVFSLSSDKPSLAVMYFENRSGIPDLDNMLVDMLITNLSQVEGLEVISSQRLFDITRQIGRQEVDAIDKTTATEIANVAGVSTMLLGSIIKLEERIRIAAQLINVGDGGIIASETVDGNRIDDLFRLADELASRVSRTLGTGGGETPRDFSIADVTTASIEAYRYYQRGLEYLWEWNFVDAADQMKRAIEIDPTFAMAYLFLAMSDARYGLNINDPFSDISQIKDTLALAKKYSQKATERERLLIDSQIAILDRNFDVSYEKVNDLVEKYPRDTFVLQVLAGVAWMNKDWEKCREAYERSLEIDPANANSYNDLAYVYAFLGDYEQAISTVKKPIALQPDNANTYDSAWEIHMKAGKFDEALDYSEEGLRRGLAGYAWDNHSGYTFLLKGDADEARIQFRKRIESNPETFVYQTRIIGCSYLLEGKYEQSLSEFQKAVEKAQEEKNAGQEIFARLDLGKILAVQKRYERAVEEYSEAEKLSWKVYDEKFNPVPAFSGYLVGYALAQKGDEERARAQAVRLSEILEHGNYEKLHHDFYYLLLGEIGLAQKNAGAIREALNELTSWTHLVSPHFKKLEAAALALSGDDEGAIQAYQDFNTDVQRIDYGMSDHFYFFYERSLVDYNIAKIHEKMGNKENAVDFYEKFLAPMKAADPGIAEVENAKQRLAAIR